jgi:hypothetical protein
VSNSHATCSDIMVEPRSLKNILIAEVGWSKDLKRSWDMNTQSKGAQTLPEHFSSICLQYQESFLSVSQRIFQVLYWNNPLISTRSRGHMHSQITKAISESGGTNPSFMRLELRRDMNRIPCSKQLMPMVSCIKRRR